MLSGCVAPQQQQHITNPPCTYAPSKLIWETFKSDYPALRRRTGACVKGGTGACVKWYRSLRREWYWCSRQVVPVLASRVLPVLASSLGMSFRMSGSNSSNSRRSLLSHLGETRPQPCWKWEEIVGAHACSGLVSKREIITNGLM